MPKPALRPQKKLTQSTQAKRSPHNPIESKDQKPTKEAKRPTTPTAKAANILAIRKHHPGLTMREIAATVKASHSYVIEVLQRYGIIQKQVEDYKSHRADIWDGISHALLSSLSTEDIKKMPGAARVMSAGIAYDKMRIERGLSDSSSKPLVVIQVAGQTVHIKDSTHSTIDVSGAGPAGSTTGILVEGNDAG